MVEPAHQGHSVSAGESQRWSEVRMIMRRLSNGQLSAVVLHRTVDGQRIWDRRLDQVEVPLPVGSEASVDLHAALDLALSSLRAKRAHEA